jgi:hypothetical protein
MENFWVNVIWSVTPTILLGILFWWIIRSILRADRKEREVYAQIEAEERSKRGMSEPDAT